MTADGEIPLFGGRITAGVVRLGDTVRRPRKSGTVDLGRLLAHLEDGGFDAAPRFLGSDEKGRVVLSFIPGDVPTDLGHFDDAQLVAAARLLRRFHDATADFGAARSAGAEVICHNDFGPPNAVFQNNLPVALIDFDAAAPGTRLWDLGYSIFSWLNLGEDEYSGPEQLRRLELFVGAYLHPACTAALAAIHVLARQSRLAAWAKQIGEHPMEQWARNAADWTAANVLERFYPISPPPHTGSESISSRSLSE